MASRLTNAREIMTPSASLRACGARRVWRDGLGDGSSCGTLRLMRNNASSARPRRRGKPKDDGDRSVVAGTSADRDLHPVSTSSCHPA